MIRQRFLTQCDATFHLAACGIDVASTRLANVGGIAGLAQHPLKGVNTMLRRSVVIDFWTGAVRLTLLECRESTPRPRRHAGLRHRSHPAAHIQTLAVRAHMERE